MRRRWLILAIISFFLVFALASVRMLIAPIFIWSPDVVHIVVTAVQQSPAHKTVIFDHQFPHQAQAVYQQLTFGAQLTGNEVQSCPANSNQLPYYHYELTFFIWA